jgi:hypothetical protein
MESDMFLQKALDEPNHTDLAEQIELSAQATFPSRASPITKPRPILRVS